MRKGTRAQLPRRLTPSPILTANPLSAYLTTRNRWDRQLYVNGDGSLKSGWNHITNNIIFNGPSDDRDLGNLYPAIDNDDGSQVKLSLLPPSLARSHTLTANRNPTARHKPTTPAPTGSFIGIATT